MLNKMLTNLFILIILDSERSEEAIDYIMMCVSVLFSFCVFLTRCSWGICLQTLYLVKKCISLLHYSFFFKKKISIPKKKQTLKKKY